MYYNTKRLFANILNFRRIVNLPVLKLAGQLVDKDEKDGLALKYLIKLKLPYSYIDEDRICM